MKIVTRAPARIDPAGAGTDAPPYSVEYGGCVVNFAVVRHSYAQFQWLPPGAGVHLCSLESDCANETSNTLCCQLNGYQACVNSVIAAAGGVTCL